MSAPRLLEVSDSVLCVHRPEFLSCSYVVDTPEGVVLVDAGIDPTGEDMATGIRAFGAAPEDVQAILLTHWHNDHASGAPAIQRLSGARVYYHADGAERFQREKPPAAWRRAIGRRLPERGLLAALKGLFEVGPPEPLFAHRLIQDGDIVESYFRVLGTPGHARGHVSYVYEPERVLFTGDALAVASGRVAFMSRYLTDDLLQARSSMQRCLEQDVVALCPGHRYPLLGVTEERRQGAMRRIEATRTWPIYGC